MFLLSLLLVALVSADEPGPTAAPVICKAGYIVKEDSCVPCVPGTYSTGGQMTICLSCPAGSTSFAAATDALECFVPRECAWGAGEHPCDAQTGCNYGCSEDYCWSQCNGACPRLGNLVTICHGCKEWCWLSGDDGDYVQCGVNSDCFTVHRNSCAGPCSY